MRTERVAPAASRGVSWITARSAGWLSIIVAFAIGFLRLAGGLLHVTLLTSVAPTWIEMKPITLVCFFLSAGALILIYLRPAGRRRSIGAMVLGSLVGLVGLVTIADFMVDLATGRPPSAVHTPFLNLFLAASTRMALITAVVFTLVGSALALLAAGARRAANVAHVLALLAAVACYVVPIGYLLGVPAMSAVLGTAMALNTGIALCFVCLAVLCARTDTWLMQELTGDETGGYMARRLLPALMATPLVVGWLRLQGERTGLFSSEVGVALVVTTYTLVFVVLVWLAARAANRSDALRQVAERAVQESEGQFRAVSESSAVLLVVTRQSDNVILFTNAAFDQAFGYAKGELVGSSAPALYVDPGERAAMIDTLTAKGLVQDMEVQVRRKDGTQFWASTSVRRLQFAGAPAILGAAVDITERKRTEEALRRSEATLRGILDATRESVWLFSTDGVVLQANATALARFGKAGPDVVGKSLEEILTPELAASRRARLQEVVESARPVEFEDERAGMQFRHSFYPVLDARGTVVAVTSFSRDITASRRAEQALRESEARYRVVADNTYDWEFWLDPEGRFLYASPSCERVTGHKPEEFIADPELRFRIVHPEDRQTLVDHARHVESKEQGALDYRIIHRDGSVRWIGHVCQPVFDASGRFLGTRGSNRDITERKRAEEELARTNEVLETLLATAPLGFCHLDRELRFLRINDRLAAMNGIPAADHLGKTVAEVLPALLPAVQEVTTRILAAGEAVTGHEFSGETPLCPGVTRYWSESWYPVRAASGAITGFGVIVEEITERKRAEQTLQESEERLRKLYSAMSEGLALQQMVYDESDKATDYRIVDVNPAFEAITGLSRDKAVGRLASELYGTGSPPFIDTFAKVAETGTPLDFETEFAPMAKCFHISAFSPGKGIFATVFSDITARKQSERRLAEQAAMLSQVSDAIVGVDADYRITYWSPSAERLYGYSAAEAKGRTVTELTRATYVDKPREAAIAGLTSAGHSETETIQHTKDGRELFIETHAAVLRDDAGAITAVVAVNRDITERKRADAALRASEARFRGLAEALPQHVWTANAEGGLDWLNQRWYDYTGMKPGAADGWGWGPVTHPDELATITAKWQEALRTSSVYSNETRIRRFDGEFRWFLVRAWPLCDEAGKVIRWFGTNTDIHDLKQAQQELNQVHHRLALAQQSAGAGMWDWDMATGKLEWSPELFRLFGLDPDRDEPSFETWRRIIHPDDRAAAEERINTAIRDRVRLESEYRIVLPSGEIRWVSAPGDTQHDNDGRPVRMSGICIDVTTRRQAVDALREAKETLEVRVKERTIELTAQVEERRRAEEKVAAAAQYARSLLESSLDPLVTISAGGKITDVNEATVKATGIPREQLIGTDFCDYFTEPEKAREGYRRVFAEGFVTDYPLTIRHRDGRLTDVLYNASVYTDTRGNIVGVFAAARDVTDRKRAEALVEAERQRLRDVLNLLPAYVVLLAPDYSVPFANRFFEERFGKSLGRCCYDYLFQRTEPCENCESYKVMKTKGPHHWEWTGPDGRDYDIYDFPFTDVDGSPLVMEMGIDVTEQKRAEQALQKAHDSLEVKVAERTADLTRSNADLEQFAYAASHDLQEPLRMVANYVGLLGQRYRTHIDDKADRYIDYAVGGAKRMQALVDGLLHYSRVGTKEAAATELDVTAVVAEAQANLRQRIEEAGAVVEVGPLPMVTADRVQLTQVFQNLLDNAMKFHGATAPVVSVTCRDVGSDWEFAVRDNGIGIDPQYAERIFGVFKRLHTEQEYPGTGIGLALCRKIVERHGGRIHVEPVEGGGSLFLFTLPKRPAARFNEPAGRQSEEDK